jgi:hypothetical protein
MPISPEKYIRKPLVVVGVEVTADNFMELALWVQGSIMNIDGSETDGPITPEKQFILVRVHNPKSPRQSRAFVGDWILYSDRGYKVYSPKAFKNTFDPVNAEFTREKAEKAKRAEADRTKATREEMLDQENINPADALHNELDDKDGPVLTRDNEKEAAAKQAQVELEDSDYDDYVDVKKAAEEHGE